MSEDAYGTRVVAFAAADEARKLAGSSPWSCRWRARPDGAVDLVVVQDSRVVLLMVSGDGSPRRLAQSVPQSRTSSGLQFGCLVAIVSFFLGVVWHWFFVLVLLGAVAWAIGQKLDESPPAAGWAEELGGTPWARVPRKVGGPMPTGSQLIAASAIADEHGERAFYRDRGDGIVEVATGVNDRELRSLDRFGREIGVRDLPVKALSRRQLRRELGEPSDWHELRTDEPSD